nr:hypothetical protein [Tanacetum cinerariifolium]
PLSSDYVPGLEEPEQAPLSPDYVPGPKELEQAPPSPRLRFASPTPSQEVEESSAAGAARQNKPTIARDDPYSLIEARMAREAWGLSMDARDNAHSDAISLRTMLLAQHALILDLLTADRRKHGVIKELLTADHKRQVRHNLMHQGKLVAVPRFGYV